MYKGCVPFPTEYQHEFTEKKIDRLEPKTFKEFRHGYCRILAQNYKSEILIMFDNINELSYEFYYVDVELERRSRIQFQTTVLKCTNVDVRTLIRAFEIDQTVISKIRPVEDWETKVSEKPKLSEKSEALARRLILDRYKSAYQIQFDKEILDRYAREKEEKDLGSELVNYIRNLYNNPHTEEVPRVLYTTARIFGYTSPKDLHCELSTYQDVHGRSGGQVMLQNLQKVIASKRRRMVLSKLEANLGVSALDSNTDQCKS